MSIQTLDQPAGTSDRSPEVHVRRAAAVPTTLAAVAVAFVLFVLMATLTGLALGQGPLHGTSGVRTKPQSDPDDVRRPNHLPRPDVMSRSGDRRDPQRQPEQLAHKVADSVTVEVDGGSQDQLEPGHDAVTTLLVSADATALPGPRGVGRIDLRVCLSFANATDSDRTCTVHVVGKRHVTEFEIRSKLRAGSSGDVTVLTSVQARVHVGQKVAKHDRQLPEMTIGHIDRPLWSIETLKNVGIAVGVLAALLGAVLTSLQIWRHIQKIRRERL